VELAVSASKAKAEREVRRNIEASVAEVYALSVNQASSLWWNRLIVFIGYRGVRGSTPILNDTRLSPTLAPEFDVALSRLAKGKRNCKRLPQLH
jgi:hypothetical protein